MPIKKSQAKTNALNRRQSKGLISNKEANEIDLNMDKSDGAELITMLFITLFVLTLLCFPEKTHSYDSEYAFSQESQNILFEAVTDKAKRNDFSDRLTKFGFAYGQYDQSDLKTECFRILQTKLCHCEHIVAAQALCDLCPDLMKSLGFKKVSLENVRENCKPFETFVALSNALAKHKLESNMHFPHYESAMVNPELRCSEHSYDFYDFAANCPPTIMANILEFYNLMDDEMESKLEQFQILTSDEAGHDEINREGFKVKFMHVKKITEEDLPKYSGKPAIYMIFKGLDSNLPRHYAYFTGEMMLEGAWLFKRDKN